jgi:hypothetical protein
MAFHKTFSSEVDTGSRQENAEKQKTRAFSDPMGSKKALARGECLGDRGLVQVDFFGEPRV